MSVSLEKTGKVSLSKEAESQGIGDLDKVNVGLGWRASTTGSTYDLDAWAMVARAGRQFSSDNLIYYGHRADSRKTIRHQGDDLVGAGSGDNEIIEIDLKSMPEDYMRVYVGVTIYMAKSKRQKFGDVKNTFIRVFDRKSGKELCRYADEFSGALADSTTMLMGYFERRDNEWDFVAVGDGKCLSGIKDVPEVYGNYALVSLEKKDYPEDHQQPQQPQQKKGFLSRLFG